MLIDLHAHNLIPQLFHHDPTAGPFFVTGEGGRWNIRIGDWGLGLGHPRRQGAGQFLGRAPSKESGLAGIPKNPLARLEKMDAAGIDRMVLAIPAHM